MGGFSDSGPLGIEGAAAWITTAPEAVRDHLLTYTATYSGRFFEWFISRSDRASFTADDMLAVSALSVDMPTLAAQRLIADEAREFRPLLSRADELLAQVGAPEGLADMDLDGELAATLSDLYASIRDLSDVGKVRASKLLAAKFPAHVPIRDARVEQLLGLTKSRKWWSPIQQLLNSAGVVEVLETVALPEERPHVTTLRRLDIVLWREAELRGLG